MNFSIEGRSNRVPDFLLAGAPRCGTSTLYSYLSRAAGIFMSREKEPEFFLAWDEQPYYIDDRRRYAADYISYTREDYLRLFKPARQTDVIGEASSWYLYGGEKTIANIRRLYGQQARRVKIIFILRSPVERAWSHYWLKRNQGEEHLPFAEAIRPKVVQDRMARRCSLGFDYLGQSLYSRNVETFLESFDAVKVLLFDDFRRDAVETLTGLFEFLGLKPPVLSPKTKRLNTSGVSRSRAAEGLSRLTFQPNALKSLIKHLIPRALRYNLKNRVGARLFQQPILVDSLRRELAGFFREDIVRLERVIGRDLGVWLSEPSSQNCRLPSQAGEGQS